MSRIAKVVAFARSARDWLADWMAWYAAFTTTLIMAFWLNQHTDEFSAEALETLGILFNGVAAVILAWPLLVVLLGVYDLLESRGKVPEVNP